MATANTMLARPTGLLEDAERLQRYIRVIVYTFFAVSIVMIQVQNPINRATAVGLVVVGFLTLWLSKREQFVVASYLIPTALTIAFTIFSFNGDGIVDPGVFGYTVVIMMGGLLAGKRGATIYGVAAILCIWGLYAVGQLDAATGDRWFHESLQFSSVTYITAYLIGAIVILRLVIDTLQTSIIHARHSAVALENLNQQLEARVKDRTKALEASRKFAETLSNIGRTTNAATAYPEILEAIVQEIGVVDYMIALSLYENYQREDATYSETVAMLLPQQLTAQATSLRVPLAPTENLDPVEPGLIVIENVDENLTDQPEVLAYLKQFELEAIMIYDFYLGDRIIGTLTFASSDNRTFTQFERDLIQGVGDLAAAATERSRLYSEQVKIAEELRTLDNMKSQFLASMSHELRTPLNAILNFTEFMHMEMLGPVNDKQKDALAKALGSGRHLLSLINDILDITKIEAGMMRLFIEENIDLQQELNTVIASANSLIQNKTIEFKQEIDNPLPTIVADKRRIRQVLLNLLSNAIKFTEQGHVTLRVMNKEDVIRLEIADTGPGIADEELSIVFEPFQQTETGIRHAGGTGLGLPITKRLVEAHGGRLWVESEVGTGTTFFIELPVRSQELLEMIGEVKVTANAK